MGFLTAKNPRPEQPVDPSDTLNRANDMRSRRLQAGGSNSTFLTQAAGVASAAAKPKPTLTGLG